MNQILTAKRNKRIHLVREVSGTPKLLCDGRVSVRDQCSRYCYGSPSDITCRNCNRTIDRQWALFVTRHKLRCPRLLTYVFADDNGLDPHGVLWSGSNLVSAVKGQPRSGMAGIIAMHYPEDPRHRYPGSAQFRRWMYGEVDDGKSGFHGEVLRIRVRATLNGT